MIAAAYCRVSTDRGDQANSFASQQRYFREYIQCRPDWMLFQIYADEGITGTSTQKRAAFRQMLQDARRGRFQMLLTKEVSRFSRNILDTIACTRELKSLGVGVVFLNDGICTLDPDAELRLSIMGSIAQEESRRTSSRVKWGQTRRMEQGVVFGRSLLGFDVKDGVISVNPEGAETVRLIFHRYGVEKKGTAAIARELEQAGYRTSQGGTRWSNSHIVKILRNEKYVGDLVQKKTITPDYLTHARTYNHGEEALVVIPNHHEPIIDRELWDLVQSELGRRNRHHSDGCSNRYLFSGKIRCGVCGAGFVSRRKGRGDGTFCQRWGCRTAASKGTSRLTDQGQRIGCGIGRLLRDDTARDMLRQVVQRLKLNQEQILRDVTALVQESIGVREEQRTGLESRRKKLLQKKEAMLDAFFSRKISGEEMELLRERYDRELTALETRLKPSAPKTELLEQVRKQIALFAAGEAGCDEFYGSLLEQIVVYPDGQAEVRLRELPQRWIFRF